MASVYHPNHSITVNGKRFNLIIDLAINQSIDNFGQSCVITVSKYLKRRDTQGNEFFIFNDFSTNDKSIQRGQYVTIDLGYAKESAQVNIKQERFFEGFIANIDLNDERVVKITVEDYSYLLKKIQINQDTKTLTLKEIGELIVSKANTYLSSISSIAVGAKKITTNSPFADLKIQKFKAQNATGIDVLDLLKKNYLLQSFFIGSELRIGANFDSAFYNSLYPSDKIPVFSLYNRELIKDRQKQFYHYIISKSGLKYQFEDDRKLQIVTRCINPKTGATIEKIYGDADGDKKQLTFVGDYSESEIDNLTKQNAYKLRYTGFTKGSSFQIFGLPKIDLLSVVSFDGVGNINYLSGVFTLVGKSSYIVSGVNITYNESGFRQEVFLANKVSVDSDNEAVNVTDLPVLEGIKKVDYK